MQQKRADVLFRLYPDIKECYGRYLELVLIYNLKTDRRPTLMTKLARWHRPIYEAAALEYRLAADEMMENMDRFWEDDDGERMRKASNAYDDSILTLADAIRFALEYGHNPDLY